MTFVKFTHAKAKKAAYVNPDLVFTVLEYEAGSQIVAHGGGSIPVAESPEDVIQKLEHKKGESECHTKTN